MGFNCKFIQALKLTQSVSLNRFLKIRTLKTLSSLKPFNSKLSNLMKDGLVSEAQKLFFGMPQRNTVTYNAMIRGYFQNGFFEQAMDLYIQMPVRDIFSYNTMICGLMQYGDVKGAEEIFDCMGCTDIVTWNSMISGYIDNDLMDDAVRIFNAMPMKDVVSWNLVIAGLVKVKEFGKAEQMFRGMSTRDVASGTIMMKGFLGDGRIEEARECFDNMPIKDVQAWNTMISGYVQTGLVEIAEVLFHKMPEKDGNSWNEMMDGFVSVGRIIDAMKLFDEMPQKCERLWNLILLGLVRNGLVKEAHALLEKNSYSNIVSLTNVMIGYFNNGNVDSALKIFEWMPVRDTTVWNATIFGLGENDRSEDSIKLFIKMKEDGMFQDEATFTSLLTICSNLSSLNLGKEIHAEVIKVGINCFIPVSNALVTMYFRCGKMDSAVLEFYSMSGHDVISWNSVISGLAHHGHAEQAIEMFEKMRLSNVKPNQITFVGVLSACGHAGLVEHGKYYFNIMQNEYFLHSTTEHYTCIVDLLGRFGLIDEAMNILDQMGVLGLEVPASVWGALFGACRMHDNITIGEIAGNKILELEPSNSGVYMILAEIYLASGRKDEAERISVRMKENGVKKQPGCSWIESNDGGQVFLAGDKTHPEFKFISHVIDLIYMEMEIEHLKSDFASFSESIEGM
ncbi:pentatricopeptide repeat-containing protein At4g02750-like isoform X1 [Olea europaea var. sylvestris]|uniref:pentatricopeptide repeat-containing protein At4g02750-like isoform X1 n=2 Tax=Olea europaea var. sylvestris TaxID=158386 RepID=UPI000C1CF83D|nr:pentatricopeptide repeat-containing protein At4g02750-like isoform X1 [Olea europaea var. sylvestris]XP_022849559.1 pentatricopeptide repeat-containing protein At4g02750-like isoform X1 [Olea europaea var. sylvestris]